MACIREDYLVRIKSQAETLSISAMSKNTVKMCYPLESDPACVNSAHPSSNYFQSVWYFHGFYFQHKNLSVDPRMSYLCPTCGHQSKIKRKGLRSQPDMDFHRAMWVPNNRHIFSDYKHKITAVNYDFISQFPIRFQERFDCMFGSSVGLHNSMIKMLIYLCTKSVLFGTFYHSENETNLIKY